MQPSPRGRVRLTRPAILTRFSASLWRNAQWLRWSAAAVLITLAAFTFASAEESPDYQPATVAAVDIASGAIISPADVTTRLQTRGPPTLAPEQVVGEVARGPIANGEWMTKSRIVPGRTTEMRPGMVAFPLSLADGNVTGLLRSGDRIDILATESTGQLDDADGTSIVAEAVEVLAIPKSSDESGFGSHAGPSIVLLAATRRQALDLATTSQAQSVTIAIR